MIRSIDVRNFRCFERLTIEDCRRVNVIVGDNGAGKTALLEAIFLALGVTTNLVIRFRQMRGLDGSFHGSTKMIADAIWSDFFFDHDQGRTISVTLTGDGPEARSVRIGHGPSATLVPLDESGPASATTGVQFHWRDASGGDHVVVPTISTDGLKFPETGEDLPDFFFIGSTNPIASIENAQRFSDLSRARRQQQFVELFTREYDWVEDLSIEVVAGAPCIYASVKGLKDKVPLPSVSGGINRIVTILLTIASRPRSVVLVDEVDNGLYHKHHKSFWSAVLSFARVYDSQLFLSTHNEEWLEALSVAGAEKPSEIALWRIEREKDHPVLRQYAGKQAVAAMGAGEVR